MSEPLSFIMLQAVQANLEQITVANGFHTNAGEVVELELGQKLDGAPAFIAVIFNSSRPSEDPNRKRITADVFFTIVVKVPIGAETAQQTSHRMIDDVETAMAGKQTTYPMGISMPTWLRTDPLPDQEAMKWVGAYVRYQSSMPRKR